MKGEPLVVQPWKDAVRAKANILPITYLSHITHNEQAAAIKRNDGKFVFIPKAKVGKALGRYDGSPVGETFKATRGTFTEIPFGSPVFPGRISWWGISSTNCHETEFQALVDESKRTMPRLVEANYLKDVPESRYGNNKFIVSLPNLMKIYKQSRTDCKDKEVCLKNAGTLRYKYEICYVIMVAMEGDIDDIFPSIYGEPRFKHNGLIDNNGKLSGSSIPDLKIKHPFTCSWFDYMKLWEKYSWEILVFALYFPDDPQMVLECPREHCREKEIKHSSPCLSKQPTYPGSRHWVCPNELR